MKDRNSKRDLLLGFGIAVVAASVGIGFALLDCQLDNARQLEKQQKYRQAAEQFSLATTTSPFFKNDPNVYYEIAHCQRQGGDYANALVSIHKALDVCKQHPLASMWSRCCSNSSIEHKIMVEEGWILYASGDSARAKEQYDKTLEKEQSSGAYVGRAAAFEALKNYPAAEADYQNALKIASSGIGREQVLHERATYRRNLNQTDEAIKDLTEAIGQYACPTALYDRGALYKKKGSFMLALSDFTQSIQARPSVEQPYHSRAEVEAELGDFQAAMLDINKAIDLNPGCKLAVEDKARFQQRMTEKQK